MSQELVVEDLAYAVETTRQHYLVVHGPLYERITRICRDLETRAAMKQSLDGDLQAASAPPRPKNKRKDLAECYRRICALCHPDKIRRHDQQLIEFMQDAKEFYREQDLEALQGVYEQVKFYLADPVAYANFRKQADANLQKKHDPWYPIHAAHSTGDLDTAFSLSRAILEEALESLLKVLETTND